MNRNALVDIDHEPDPAILRIAEETRARMAACFSSDRRIAARRRTDGSIDRRSQTEM